jgi:hypothetical protein
VAGYPKQLITTDHTAKLIDIGTFWYWTHLIEPEDGKPGMTIACSFSSEFARGRDGEPARMPHLGGISGCGIWRFLRSTVMPARPTPRTRTKSSTKTELNQRATV